MGGEETAAEFMGTPAIIVGAGTIAAPARTRQRRPACIEVGVRRRRDAPPLVHVGNPQRRASRLSHAHLRPAGGTGGGTRSLGAQPNVAALGGNLHMRMRAAIGGLQPRTGAKMCLRRLRPEAVLDVAAEGLNIEFRGR